MLCAVLFVVLSLLASPVFSQENLRSSSDSIYELTQSNADFSTLATAIELADLDDVLDCEFIFCRIFTVFAPTNDAFAALPDGTLGRLTTPDFRRHLQFLLLYHVTPQRIRASDIEDGDRIGTLLAGERVNATVSDDGVQINSATVVAADIEASNGIVHGIDQVLIPEFLSKDVIGIARDAGDFSTLLAAVEAAGLTDTLSGFSNITLFAPTDAAFERLGAAALADLLDDTEALTSILTYHVVEGVVLSDELEVGSVSTLQGESISIDRRGGFFSYYGAPVLNGEVRLETIDLLASNGVIHVIDEVLIPPSVTPPTPTITELAAADPDLSTLVEALTAAGLVDTLSGEGPFTVFAPTNSAFEDLGNAVVGDLLADSEALTSVLTYHVVAGTILSDDLEEGSIPTLQGDSISVDEEGFWIFRRLVLNNGVLFRTTDIIASNGVIHLIDGVLIPPSVSLPVPTIAEVAVADPNLSTLVAALQTADLVGTLGGEGPFTVFAPTDAAFAKLDSGVLNSLLDDAEALTSVLLYHVVSGRVMREDLEEGLVTTLNGATIEVELDGWGWGWSWGWFTNDVELNGDTEITEFDIEASNGVIHLIDEVLFPPQDIVSVAAANGFNTLIAAIEVANLTSALQGEGPFTVFAPTDSAFDNLPAGTLDSLLADPATLSEVLLYHVVSGRIGSDDLEEGALTTLQGQAIDVDFRYYFFFFDGIYLNDDSEITSTDVAASNGVIHVIDEVLVPPGVL